MFLSRRQFLKARAGTIAAVAVADHVGVDGAAAGDRSREPLGGIPGPVLGAGLSRSISLRFIFYLGLLPERHACLPRSGLCAQRRGDAGGAELRSPDL